MNILFNVETYPHTLHRKIQKFYMNLQILVEKYRFLTNFFYHPLTFIEIFLEPSIFLSKHIGLFSLLHFTFCREYVGMQNIPLTLWIFSRYEYIPKQIYFNKRRVVSPTSQLLDDRYELYRLSV